MICNFCEIDDIQDFVLMICNASLHFALIVVCALGATLYADVPKAFSSGRRGTAIAVDEVW